MTFTHNQNTPTLAIFDADSPPALSFVRSLGRARIPFCIYSHKAWPVARFSRYAGAFERCPNMEDAEKFSSWFVSKLSSCAIRMVAPTSDLISFHIADKAEYFDPDVRANLPESEKVLSTIFKDRFHDACIAIGQPMPWTFCPASLDEAMAKVKEMPFPLILKPKSHVVVGPARGKVILGPDELHKNFVPYDIPITNRILAEKYPEHRLPMIQERIVADFRDFRSISGVLNTDGQPVAVSASYKAGQWPADMGIGISFKSYCNDELIQRSVSLTKLLLGKGLFELEMVFHKKVQDYVPIDLNPRSFGQVTLDVARGNDLPLLWYQTITDVDVPILPPASISCEWIHCIPYHLDKVARLIKGPDRGAAARETLRLMRNPHVDVVNDIKDPLPSIPFAFSIFRHPISLVREIWKDKTR